MAREFILGKAGQAYSLYRSNMRAFSLQFGLVCLNRRRQISGGNRAFFADSDVDPITGLEVNVPKYQLSLLVC
jgi:hypothetical protein